MASKLNTFTAGMIVGLIGPIIGFFLYGVYFCHRFLTSMSYYVTEVFFGTKPYQSPIATLSLLFNLGLFFLFLKLNWERGAQGILGATFVYVPIIVFLFFY